ncbi:MAG: integration host factor subunit alpha [Alphaproteobacteria bacterium]
MSKVLTKVNIAEKIYNKTGIPRVVISDIIGCLFEEVCINLERGKNVKLSSFGTFKTREKSARIGRNPKTGKEAVIEARRVVVFYPNNTLKKDVAKVK